MTAIYRQGDVLITRIEGVPEGVATVPREDGKLVLAHGEASGHAHVVEGEAQLLAADIGDLEERFLHLEEEARLVHDEHESITLPPGDYRVVRQSEYTPATPRFVAD